MRRWLLTPTGTTGIGALLLSSMVAAVAASERCPFDTTTLQFAGTPVEQARCLLRPVKRYAHLGQTPVALPEALERRIGRTTGVTAADLRRALEREHIDEADIGGAVDAAVSRTQGAASLSARYFVIHDTSTPNLGVGMLSDEINTAAWPYQDLARWRKGSKSKAHVFINRLGDSTTAVDFGRGWRAVKLELKYDELFPGQSPESLRGRFLHVELVQPRRSARADGKGDAEAPVPGFTEAQYRRLALVYVAASVRAGEWLIPAFHAVLDHGIPNGHDDPQNFDIAAFADAVAVWEKISADGSLASTQRD